MLFAGLNRLAVGVLLLVGSAAHAREQLLIPSVCYNSKSSTFGSTAVTKLASLIKVRVGGKDCELIAHARSLAVEFDDAKDASKKYLNIEFVWKAGSRTPIQVVNLGDLSNSKGVFLLEPCLVIDAPAELGLQLAIAEAEDVQQEWKSVDRSSGRLAGFMLRLAALRAFMLQELDEWEEMRKEAALEEVARAGQLAFMKEIQPQLPEGDSRAKVVNDIKNLEALQADLEQQKGVWATSGTTYRALVAQLTRLVAEVGENIRATERLPDVTVFEGGAVTPKTTGKKGP